MKTIFTSLARLFAAGNSSHSEPLPLPQEQLARRALDWLCLAQDRSASQDGGVARHCTASREWAPSYPETTGYIIPTFIECAKIFSDPRLSGRAKLMSDWLMSIQSPSGGFHGGTVDAEPKVPVTFNTGQILIGLAAAVAEFGDEYRFAVRKAAQWLATTQDADGCWRKHQTPFAASGEKAYETHVSWGLIEAARVDGNELYSLAARRNLDWAISKQFANGWVADCCLTDNRRPLTHTLGYYLRGLVEGYLYFREEKLLSASLRTAHGLCSAIREDGFLPGRLQPNWKGAVKWACLTGSSQIAHSLLLLYRETGFTHLLTKGQLLLDYVGTKAGVTPHEETTGAVPGSWPLTGGYCANEYPNWAAKFTIDAILERRKIEAGAGRETRQAAR